MDAAVSRAGAPPRHTVHRGTVLVSALWFAADAGQLGVATQRIVALWRPGARVYAAPGALLLELSAPQRFCAAEAPALPLVAVGDCLFSAPLSERECAELKLESSAIVIVNAGRVCVVRRAELSLVDASRWLDLSPFELDDAPQPHDPPAPPLKLAPPVDTTASFDAQIGRTASEHASQSEVVQALARLQGGASESLGHPAAGTAREATAGRLGRVARGLLRELKVALASLFRALRPRSSASQGQGLVRYEPGASWWERVRRRFALRIARSRLMRALGRRHAEYLGHLLDLLSAQRDLEVLKYAIPLGSGTGPEASPALLPPRPRDQIGLSLVKARPGPTLGLAEDLFARLRAAYEAMFARLDAAQRVDEAAFVLAELLDSPERAVAYLERHGRYRLAAELAEGRRLAPGLVVRQWFLASDRERASAIAAQTGAFEDAIERLERSGHTNESSTLRLLYAERLAAAGKLVAAARVAEHLEPARSLVLTWLGLARSLEDYRGVALELTLEPARFGAVWRDLEPWLSADGPDAERERQVLANGLLTGRPEAARPIARELARALLYDAGREGSHSTALLAKALAAWVGGELRADFPEIVTYERRVPRRPFQRRYPQSDAGTRAVFDAQKLGRGYLVALGEAGVALLNADGKPVAHFDVPAEHLVVGKQGAHVLALIPRGNAYKVSRIHLGTRRAEAWTELRLAAFCREFDGQSWAVVLGAQPQSSLELSVLDVIGDEPSLLHRLPLVPEGNVASLELHTKSLSVIACEPDGSLERFRYELPAWTLRERTAVPLSRAPENKIFLGAISADDYTIAFWDAWLADSGYVAGPLVYDTCRIELPELQADRAARLIARDGCFALVLESDGSTRVLAGTIAAERVTVDIELVGSVRVSARLGAALLTLADDMGRLVVFDVASASCMADIRWTGASLARVQ